MMLDYSPRPTPWLHFHYRSFTATMDQSDTVRRFATLTLIFLPLALLAYHRCDRFPRSHYSPNPRSRLLSAGCRMGSSRVSPMLSRNTLNNISSDIVLEFRQVFRGSLAFVSLKSHLTALRRLFHNAHDQLVSSPAACGSLKPPP
jgi:hypothetical protein